MKFNFKKSAFTLAEIMIVLTVVGILTAILLPVAYNAAPDEDVMKFKKANSTLAAVVRELVNSDKYYLDGDLGMSSDGSAVEDSRYFCNTFKDIVSIKSAECIEKTSCGYPGELSEDWELNGTISNSPEEELDKYCKNYTTNISKIITSDNIIFYEPFPECPFGVSPKEDNYYRMWDRISVTSSEHYGKGFYYLYKPFCIDIDEIDKGEDPFGYGIRVDGRILSGARAIEWSKKSIQRGNEE